MSVEHDPAPSLTSLPHFATSEIPRAELTQTLRRIARRLAEGELIRQVTRPAFRMARLPAAQLDMEVMSLWVVGSYARGALTCGDLDLVIQVRRCDGLPAFPPDTSITRAFIGSPRDTSIYIGTPDCNTSGVSFPDAKLIWRPDGISWEERLAGIPVHPAAARFYRPSDALPLSTQQFFAEEDQIEQLLAAQAAGVVAWEFLPFDTRQPTPEVSSYFAARIDEFGAHTRQTLRYFIAQAADRWPEARLRGGVREGLRLGGYRIGVGAPVLPRNLLPSVCVSAEVVIPHMSRRGPNGAWVISRGPQHALIRHANAVSVWAITEEGRVSLTDVHDYDHGRRLELELFSSLEVAREVAEGNDDEAFRVERVSGKRLLDALARADVLVLTGKSFIKDFVMAQPSDDEVVAFHDALFLSLQELASDATKAVVSSISGPDTAF